MILLQTSHIFKSFGAQTVLNDVTIDIKDNDRIGLIGANGVGKSTLLKIINGEIETDNGRIFTGKNTTTGYLAQDGGVNSDRTIWEEMLKSFDYLLKQEEKLRKLEENMADQSVIANQKKFDSICEQYSNLEEHFRNAGGYSYTTSIRNVLYGLKFNEEDFNRKVSTLSGGQKTRFALGKLLALEPDILMLDEPTNYLDMETMEWLGKYLQSYRGAILLVSHDRYFLDQLTNITLELKDNKIKEYHGNYSRYLDLKSALAEQQAKELKKNQEKRKSLELFVQKNIARASTSGQAKARQKQLEKMETVEEITPDEKPHLTLDTRQQGGNDVLAVRDLSVGYQEKTILQKIDFDIYRGERVALLGPNGAGKSTILKTITGCLLPLAGTIRVGINVNIAYLEQELDSLSEQLTILEELWGDFPDLEEKRVRAILGQFLFTGEEVFKKVLDLSGGEKARLALAKIMCQRANFLILDEPTNHLDIYSKEALEDALLNYSGTLLFVSHDRYFLNKIATRIIEVSTSGITNYVGDYNYYLYKKTLESAKNKTVTENINTATKPGKAKTDYHKTKDFEREIRKRDRRIEELEQIIAELEQTILLKEAELFQPQVYNDHKLFHQKNNEAKQLHSELESCLEEWVSLEEGKV